MLPYIILYIGLLFFSLILSIRYNGVIDKSVGVIFVFSFVFVSGLRVSGGTDLPAYLELWRNIIPGTLDTYRGDYSYFEPGFRLFMGAVKYFSESNILYLASVALLIHSLNFYGFYKARIPIVFGNFIYLNIFFISYSLNAVQQAIAMAIMVSLISRLMHSNFITGYLTSLLFVFMHKSMVLFLASSYFLRKQFSIVVLVLLLVFAFLVYYFSFFNILISQFAFLSGFTDFEKKITIFNFVYKISVFFICVLIIRYSKPNVLDRALFVGVFLGLVLYVAFFDVAVLATRLFMFFRVFEMILIGRFFFKVKFGLKRFMFVFIVSIIYLPVFISQIIHEDSYLLFNS
jgi:hypothetical protein